MLKIDFNKLILTNNLKKVFWSLRRSMPGPRLVSYIFVYDIINLRKNKIKNPNFFRTSGTGLYDNLDDYQLDSATDIFDLRFFKKNPRPFFQLAKTLYPGNHKQNDVHFFLKLLSVKKKLLRVYTQNIDCLETSKSYSLLLFSN